jgi:hypothetical protein
MSSTYILNNLERFPQATNSFSLRHPGNVLKNN